MSLADNLLFSPLSAAAFENFHSLSFNLVRLVLNANVFVNKKNERYFQQAIVRILLHAGRKTVQTRKSFVI